LHPCIVLNSPLRFVQMRDRELVTFVGWLSSWLYGWCSGELFMEAYEEARVVPLWRLWNGCGACHLHNGEKASKKGNCLRGVWEPSMWLTSCKGTIHLALPLSWL
jgi:hypothetical protein